MPDSGMAQFVEVLSVARARTDLDAPERRPIIVLTIRPQPDRSWAYHNLGLSMGAARRLRDDLSAILKTPTTFILMAALALGTGCSAKVEVVSERSAAVEDGSAAAPPVAAVEKSRTAVEVDVLGQKQSEPAVSKVAAERKVTAAPEGEPGEFRGDVTLIVVRQVQKHRHYHLPIVVGRGRWASCDDEAERIRRIHEMKLRQYGVR